MKPIKHLTSACKYCRHYQPEGRRGGVCGQLGSPVQGTWKACSLAIPPFAPSWESLEDAWILADAKPVSASAGCVTPGLDNAKVASHPEIAASFTSEQAKAKAVSI